MRIPRFSDRIQCTCPKHTIVERKIAALNVIMKILVPGNTNLHVVRFPGITVLIEVIFFIIFSEKVI